MATNNSSVKMSAMYMGYLILKEIKEKKVDKISIYEVSKALKQQGITSSRQLVLGLSFLYAVDLVDFEEAHVWLKK